MKTHYLSTPESSALFSQPGNVFSVAAADRVIYKGKKFLWLMVLVARKAKSMMGTSGKGQSLLQLVTGEQEGIQTLAEVMSKGS